MNHTSSHISEHNQEIQVNIQGKHLQVTEPLREYVLAKVAKCERLVNSMININVRLEVQKLDQICDILIHFSHFRIKAQAVTPDLYASIDKAFDRIYGMVRKWKTRIQSHHAKGLSAQEMEVQVLEYSSETEKSLDEEILDANNNSLKDDFPHPKIAKVKRRPLKVLTLRDALMKIELSGDNFLIFKSEEDKGLKVLYRRRDGTYGLVTPES